MLKMLNNVSFSCAPVANSQCSSLVLQPSRWAVVSLANVGDTTWQPVQQLYSKAKPFNQSRYFVPQTEVTTKPSLNHYKGSLLTCLFTLAWAILHSLPWFHLPLCLSGLRCMNKKHLQKATADNVEV